METRLKGYFAKGFGTYAAVNYFVQKVLLYSLLRTIFSSQRLKNHEKTLKFKKCVKSAGTIRTKNWNASNPIIFKQIFVRFLSTYVSRVYVIKVL